MHKVELTEGEIRAIMSYYDNVMLYIDEVEENFCGSYTAMTVMRESFDEARHHIKSRVNYLMNLLDSGR